MARFVNCKKGLHSYSPIGRVGGGIARRTCSVCGNVQIDLSEVAAVNSTDLFTEPKLASMFEVEALLAKVGSAPVAAARSFGEAPARRRRPARAAG
jgi:hypothetical protein